MYAIWFDTGHVNCKDVTLRRPTSHMTHFKPITTPHFRVPDEWNVFQINYWNIQRVCVLPSDSFIMFDIQQLKILNTYEVHIFGASSLSTK